MIFKFSIYLLFYFLYFALFKKFCQPPGKNILNIIFSFLRRIGAVHVYMYIYVVFSLNFILLSSSRGITQPFHWQIVFLPIVKDHTFIQFFKSFFMEATPILSYFHLMKLIYIDANRIQLFFSIEAQSILYFPICIFKQFSIVSYHVITLFFR